MTEAAPAPHAPAPAPGAAARSGPLRSVRIVEFGAMGPVPFAAMLLADMGADVVRLVRPGAGVPGPQEILARGRRVAAADLKRPADRDAVLALLGRADVLLEGFRPGVMERLGLGPAAVHALNPRLVYARMTGWGQTGPLAQAAGHDLNYIALTGALAAIGTAERPVVPLNLVGDYGGGGMVLIAGVLAALLEARLSGQGQVIDAAMCDGAAALMTTFYQFHAMGTWQPQREGNRLDGGAHFYGLYACRDGGFVAVGPIEPAFYQAFLDKLGLAGDAQFARQDDRSLWPLLRQRLAALFATRSRDEWAALFGAGDACVSPVLGLHEAPAHPHLAARGTFTTRDGVVQPAPVPRFSRTPSAIQAPMAGRAAPLALDEVLAGWRG